MILLAMLPMASKAQTCELPVSIYIPEDVGQLPYESVSVLENSLTRLATASNFITDLNMSSFVMTIKVDVLDKIVTPTVPAQIVYTLGATLYLADVYTQTKFSSAYVEIKGVGTNETKSLIDACRRINANNTQIKEILHNGRKKIMTYYDNNYRDIVKRAEQKAALEQYEEAIALAISVPTCSKGGDVAQNTALKIYATYRDKLNLALLNRARVIWAAGQNQDAANEAGLLLSQIDSDASCYGDAISLINEMKKQVRLDIDLEKRDKYKDSVELERQRINAIREVGIAYGRGQKPVTTNLTWLR